MTITLPLPPAILWPNSREFWAKKAKVTAQYRLIAKLAARNAMPNKFKPLKTATVQATFYFETKRRRDRDNMQGSLKAAFDGFADAGLIENDCGFTHLPVRAGAHDAKTPRVEIEVTA